MKTAQHAAPHLKAHDIEQELKRIYRRDRSTHLVAVFGSGDAADIAVQGRRFEVVPTRCELEMRAKMPPIAKNYEPGRVYLVDWARQLPLDLACRLAGQKLYHIASEARLGSLFGARQVDPALQGSALAKVLLAQGTEPWRSRLGSVSAQFLRQDEAYWRFLQAFCGYPLLHEMDPAGLLVWCALDDHGGAFAQQQSQDERWGQLGGELMALLERKAGKLGRLIGSAWLANKGQELIQYALLVDAVQEGLERSDYAEGRLSGALDKLGVQWGKQLLDCREQMGSSLLVTVLEKLDAASPETRLGRQLIDVADKLVEDNEFWKGTDSAILPRGYRQRERGLASALLRAGEAKVIGINDLRDISDGLASVHAHYLDKACRPQDVRCREMGVRLAYYLAHRPSPSSQLSDKQGYHQALVLADAYVQEGGYVDWARGVLRGMASVPMFGPAYAAILNRVDVARLEDDRRFAMGVVEWLKAGSPSDRALPISEVSKRIVAEFLGKNHRKLLVLLMDGMSWANTVELVASLVDESGRWGPTTWQPKGHEGRVAFLPPVLAALPSLTNVSRSALFAGKQPKSGKMPSTGDDPKRWVSNRHARKCVGEGEEPVLLLKDLATREGGVAQDALKMVGSDRRLVAIVINAIDDQLSGSDQVTVHYTANEIKPLGGILDAAMAAERAVLLVSDHGHVPGQAMVSVGKKAALGGSRWRAVEEGEDLEEFEVELPRQAWWPAGAERMAVIWDERKCYGQPKAGKHGGASLAEVVAPAMLVVPDVLVTDRSGKVDEELTALALPAPEWWACEVPRDPSAKETPRRPKKRKSDPPANQLSLLGTTIAPKTSASTAQVESALVTKLRESAVFVAHVEGQQRDQVEEALSALGHVLAAGDRMGIDAFARKSAVPGWRVSGFVSSRLSPVFNYDGYSVIEYDRQGKQLVVSRERLCQLFDIAE